MKSARRVQYRGSPGVQGELGSLTHFFMDLPAALVERLKRRVYGPCCPTPDPPVKPFGNSLSC